MTVVTTQQFGYLERPYLTLPYLGGGNYGNVGMQANFQIETPNATGQQANVQIVSATDDNFNGMQAEYTIETETATGMQAEIKTLLATGMQANYSLYNTTNLRLLCEFPSRGLEGATGLNAWGNTAGAGLNWKTNSQESGDFDVSNLNTDIVEQTWRSDGVVVGVNLDCDTERPQGVFNDTTAILNHNLTSSADVTLIGSNTSDFSVVGVAIPLEARDTDPNIYYIASTLPNTGYRYWRISIDDSSNPDGYLEVGTIVFGGSRIFVGECFVDEVTFNLKDFADEVNTEGFTNVANSRAQKKNLTLDFRSLDFSRSNFRLMREVFQFARTTLKCLWIPTPDPVNQDFTARFALFAKMTSVPVERHNVKGADADYVNFTLELDESK